jgi:hypothetical protein
MQTLIFTYGMQKEVSGLMQEILLDQLDQQVPQVPIVL